MHTWQGKVRVVLQNLNESHDQRALSLRGWRTCLPLEGSAIILVDTRLDDWDSDPGEVPGLGDKMRETFDVAGKACAMNSKPPS